MNVLNVRGHLHHLFISLFILYGQLSLVKTTYIHVPDSKIDIGFSHLDKNADGVVAPDEFGRLINTDDKNGDGCVSKAEYEDGAEAAHALSDLMFGYFDSFGTDCLTSQTMILEFAKADKDASGRISVQEWETYFQHLMKQLFQTSSATFSIG